MSGVTWKYDAAQDTLYVNFVMLDVMLRLDADGTFMLSVRHKSTTLSGVSGVCGDWNDSPESMYKNDLLSNYIYANVHSQKHSRRLL